MNALDDLELELRKLPGVRAAGFDERDDVLLVQLHLTPGRGEHGLPVAATRIAARHSDRPVAVEVIRWRESAPPAPPLAPPAARPGDEPARPAEPDEAPPIDLTAVAADEAPAEPASAAAADPPPAPAREGAAGQRRPRLLAVLSFPDTDELEVHLILEGRRTIGRSAASRGLVAAVEAAIEALRDLGAPGAPAARWARPVEAAEDEGALVAVALDTGDGGRAYGIASGSSPIDAAARATLDALNRRLELVV